MFRGRGEAGRCLGKNLTKLLARNSISQCFGVHFTPLCVWPCHFQQPPLRALREREGDREEPGGGRGRLRERAQDVLVDVNEANKIDHSLARAATF